MTNGRFARRFGSRAGRSCPVWECTSSGRATLIFVQGFIALGADGRGFGGNDAAAQSRDALEKVKRRLEAGGGSFADVCKVTVFYRESRTAKP